jgi:CheY-like chemotaxis protein/HPt (histidine-containing phosphotransfer) domain-containing protein
LVRLMGGAIRATSVEGRGSTFHFSLPMPDVAPVTAPAARRVALIGGDAATVSVVTEAIESLGGTVTVLVRSPTGSYEGAKGADLVLVSEADQAVLLATLNAVRALGVLRVGVLWSPLMDLPLEQLAGEATLLSLPLLPSELLRAFEGEALVGVRAERPGVAASTIDAAPSEAKGRVLVVEDNVANQKVARGYLHRLGWRVEVVANGREAVDRVQAEFFDAILMDCQMPIMNGFIATSRIRKLEGTTRHTPIIALTAGASTAERARCYEAGMDDFLTKPIREEALDAALTRWALHVGGVGQELVDRAVLSRLRGLPGEQGGDLIGELIDMLAGRVAGVALTMRNEARQRRFDVVTREAHGLKGLALTLGAVALADRCRAIEAAASAGEAEPVPSLVDAFEQSWLETLPQLRAARRWILADDAATPPATS